MSSSRLQEALTLVRELISRIDDCQKGRISRQELLKMIDEIENSIDRMLSEMAPERITDERFSAAEKMLDELGLSLKNLREDVLAGRLHRAKSRALEVQRVIRLTYRLMILISAAPPVAQIFQISPEYLREIPVSPPEMLRGNPLAMQIYNVIVRRREATVTDIARELNISDEERPQFNAAISELVRLGFADILLDHTGRLILRARRR
mgnify:CR=1 FL=1